MIVVAFAEVATIGAVVPVVSLMAEPESAFEYPALQSFFAAFGSESSSEIVLPLLALFIGIVVLATGLRLILLFSSTRLIMGIGYDLGVNLYSRVLNQPYSYHVQNNTSEILAATNKVQLLLDAGLNPLMQSIVAGTLSLAILGTLLSIDSQTALIGGGGIGIIYFLISKLVRVRLRQNSKIIAGAQTDRMRSVQEGLGSIRDVILDSTQPQYAAEFAKLDWRLRWAQGTNTIIGNMPRFLIEAVGIGVLLMLAYSLSLREEGLTAALPVIGALALGAQRLLPQLQTLYISWSRLMGNREVISDVLQLLALPLQATNQKCVPTLPFIHSIRFENVSFRYLQDGSEVLDGVNLTIPKGSKVGFIGSTGSGKSTTVDLLMGLLQPSDGEFFVDDTPITIGNRRAWQSKIAHVPQTIYLIDASITENIAFGVPFEDIDFELVKNSAERANIAEFIETRVEGYGTKVGERGVQLSGGQRQRIGIARALYKGAEVLVFDEATSALDGETEAKVMREIDSISSQLTVILIAHRVQTLRGCDQIVRLEGGKVAQIGSYDEMIADNWTIDSLD